MGIAPSCMRNVQRELFSAIREGDLQHVLAILSDHPKLIDDALSRNTRLSPLHYAASHGQAEVNISHAAVFFMCFRLLSSNKLACGYAGAFDVARERCFIECVEPSSADASYACV